MVKKDALLANSVLQFVQLKQSQLSLKKEKTARRTTKFEIDAFKCIYCGFCEEACPVDSIVETNIFAYHMTENHQRIQTKEMLLETGDNYKEEITTNRAKDSKFT